MTYQTFITRFKPTKNLLNSQADFDGTLFAPIELCKIPPVAISSRQIWTVIQEEVLDISAGIYEVKTFILPGVVNTNILIGYIVTEEPYEYGKNIVVKL